MKYTLGSITVPFAADPKFAELSRSERHSAKGCRVLGGDLCDIHFDGYDVDDATGTTTLSGVVVLACDGLSDNDVINVVTDCIMASYEIIGAECIEHS